MSETSHDHFRSEGGTDRIDFFAGQKIVQAVASIRGVYKWPPRSDHGIESIPIPPIEAAGSLDGVGPVRFGMLVGVDLLSMEFDFTEFDSAQVPIESIRRPARWVVVLFRTMLDNAQLIAINGQSTNFDRRKTTIRSVLVDFPERNNMAISVLASGCI